MKKIFAFMLTFIIMFSSVLFSFTASAVKGNSYVDGNFTYYDLSLEDGNSFLSDFTVYLKGQIPFYMYYNYMILYKVYSFGDKDIYIYYYYAFDSSVTEIDLKYNEFVELEKVVAYGSSNLYVYDNVFSGEYYSNAYNKYGIDNPGSFLSGYKVSLYKDKYYSPSDVYLLTSNGLKINVNGIDVTPTYPSSPSTPFEASVIGDGSTIKYNVEFLSEGNYEVNFMACTGENGENKIDYSGFSEKSGTYYYDGKSDDSSAGNGDDLGLSGGSAIDSIIAGINGEKVSTKSVYYELDLQDFYDKVQDKQNFKNAEMIYYTIEIKDLDNNNVKYFSYQLEPNTLADSVKENDSGLFSTRKDYIGFPSISDYIDTDFPDIADYVNFDMFRNMDFVDVGGLDAVLDVLKNVWIVIKTIFSFLIGNVLDFFVWLWAVLKYIFFNLLGMIKWLGACLWTIVQNIGVALYNLVVDIRRLLSWLFVPGSSFFNTYLADFKKTLYNKFGIVGEIKLFFETIIDNLSGNAEAPVWKFTIFGKECNFIDFSAFDNYQSLIHSVILAIAWVKFLKKIIVSIPSIISGSNVEISDNSPTAIPMQSTEIRPL